MASLAPSATARSTAGRRSIFRASHWSSSTSISSGSLSRSLLPPACSNAAMELPGLNYVDAQARISAAEINVGETRFAPAAIDAALGGGVLKTTFSNLGIYGGQASGELIV